MEIETKKQTEDLKKYYMLGFPLLGMMGLIAAAGIIVSFVVKHLLQII